MNGRDVRIGASLLVGDMDTMVRFYRDTLGFHTEWDGGDFAEFETVSNKLSTFLKEKGVFSVEIALSPEAPQTNKVSGKFKHAYKDFD